MHLSQLPVADERGVTGGSMLLQFAGNLVVLAIIGFGTVLLRRRVQPDSRAPAMRSGDVKRAPGSACCRSC